MTFNVILTGPDEDGRTTASIGEYVKYRGSCRVEVGDLVSMAIERATLILEAGDAEYGIGLDGKVTSMREVKADILKHRSAA